VNQKTRLMVAFRARTAGMRQHFSCRWRPVPSKDGIASAS
jgi:hypothetical protein